MSKAMVTWLAIPLFGAACSQAAPTPEGKALGARTWNNGGFESSTNGQPPASWVVSTYIDPGVTIQSPQTRAGLNLAAGGNPLTTAMYAAAGAESQPDSYLGSGASLRWPKYGNYVALVNQGGASRNVNSLNQTMTIAAGDVDPSDGNVHVRFVVAPVLQNPGHAPSAQPYYFVQLTNLTRSNILYVDYNASAQPGVPWKISNGLYYTDWQLVDIAPGSANLAIGDQVELEVIGSGCSAGGHFGQVYVDGIGSSLPGIFVSATSVAAANAGTNITYTLNYQNGGTSAVAGTSIDFNTPASTYFESVNAPGLTCTTPAVGTAGLVTCSVGTMPPGSSGTFQVTVLIDAGASGTLTEGNYSIYGTAVSPLLGPKVYTTVTSGVAYSDLSLALSDGVNGVTWGQPITYTIVATNAGPNDASGATVSDTFSANLTGVTWTCSGAGGGSCQASGTGNINDSSVALPVGATVTYTVSGAVVAGSGGGQLADTASVAVAAGASDPNTSNNAAGVYNAIAAANGSTCSVNTDCASGVCDPASATCIPVGGCGADSDCATGQWCNTSSYACVPQLVNGAAIPSVGGHTPPLAGTCTQPAATSVCVSGVCDSDNECGLATGDGPCTTATGALLCRSGACSVSGVCEPMGGCDVDGDCNAGSWCDESTNTCVLQLANGAPLPVDPAHSSPTLDGTCNAAAAILVCQGGVCDSDNLCGYANGDGSCTAANASSVCRSGACDPKDSTCGYANGDGPCNGSGAVCRSGACDSDGLCGYAVGDGPCSGSTQATLCRSQICASVGPLAGTCELCAGDTNCSGSTPACDATKGTCVTCTSSNASACTGGTPVCNTTSETCAACGGDDGSGVPLACPTTDSPYCATSGACGRCSANSDCVGAHTGPICNLTTGACGTSCAVDSDCTANKWCASGTCSPKVANGQALPSTAPIAGTCTATNGARVCLSGVCDVDNKCGLATGDGTCATGAVCRSGICPAGGPNQGKCEQCGADSDCGGATPACDTTTSVCVQCTGTQTSGCLGSTPVCDPTSHLCGGCGGDLGTSAASACPSTLAPYCMTTGACGKCTASAECGMGHAGAVCDSASGSCGAACHADTDCDTYTQFCSNITGSTGACVMKLINGTSIPGAAGPCSTAVGARVCLSGVCDPNDNACGLQNGHGPCTSGAVCMSGICVGGACAATVPVVVDAGPSDTGRDAGTTSPDAAITAEAPDASLGVDAGRVPADDSGTPAAGAGITVGGGGFSCSATTRPSGGADLGGFGLAVGLGLLVRRRRSKR